MTKCLTIFLSIILFSLIYLTSCKDDIALEPLPTLEGTYVGVYNVVSGYNTPSESVTSSTIEMLFSEESYFFNSENNPDAFCNPRGSYVLQANSLELMEKDRNCASVIATEGNNPRGTFSIRRPQDSVILIQIDSTTFKQILLKRE